MLLISSCNHHVPALAEQYQLQRWVEGHMFLSESHRFKTSHRLAGANTKMPNIMTYGKH